MKKFIKPIIFLTVLLAFTPAQIFSAGAMIDNFNNDNSFKDDLGKADAEWIFNNWDYSAIISNIDTYDNTPYLKVSYSKGSGAEWAFFFLERLYNPDNVSDFSDETSFSAEIYGNVKIMTKFKDSNGNETGDIAAIETANNNISWQSVTWSYKNVSWNNCDSKKINQILFFVQPGETGYSSFGLDNLRLGSIASTGYTGKNLLIDNFNSTISQANKLGGSWGRWTESSDQNKAFRYIQYDSVKEQVYGRTGKSMQMWYGIEELNGSWGFYSNLQNINLSNYNTVSLWALGTVDGQAFKFGFRDNFGNETKVDITNYLPGGLSSTKWEKIVIPFSAFSNVDFNLMLNYSISPPSQASGMFFIDDVVIHQYKVPLTINDFESGSVSAANGAGGSQDKLGGGTLTIETTNIRGGGNNYSAKIFSGSAGLFDDFEDAIASNKYGGIARTWIEWASGATMEISTVTTNPHQGSYCFKTVFSVAIEGQRCGWVIPLGSLESGNDVNLDYDYLTFRVRGGTGNEKFKIGLKQKDGDEPKLMITDYIEVTNSWQKVSIPLGDFGIDKSHADFISSEFNKSYGTPTSGVVYFDDFRFEGNGCWMSLNNMNLSSEENVSFYVKGASGGETLSVRVQDSDMIGAAEKEYAITNSWVKYTLPLADVTGADLTSVNAFHFSLEPYNQTIYIDDITLGDQIDVIVPNAPTNLQNNGEALTAGDKVGPRNVLSVNADSHTDDPSMEGVRFEYYEASVDWSTIGTDYDVDDGVYSVGWNASELIGKGSYIVRAVALDVVGNKGANSPEISGIEAVDSSIFVYPNPYYPGKGTGKLHFSNIKPDSVLHLYTLSGEVICTLRDDSMLADEYENDALISWDGKNPDGTYVASGIYLYMVTLNSKRENSGKFVVIK